MNRPHTVPIRSCLLNVYTFNSHPFSPSPLVTISLFSVLFKISHIIEIPQDLISEWEENLHREHLMARKQNAPETVFFICQLHVTLLYCFQVCKI